jgi:ferric-chelate reductase
VESELVMMPDIKCAMGAWLVLIWIVISAFAPVRNLRYEVFVVQHVLSFVAFVTLVMLHVPTYAMVYVFCGIGFYAVDRVVRTGWMVYRNLSVFHRGKKGLWACGAQITALPGHATRVVIKDPRVGHWSPGQHVFVHFPTISPLQSHPFTIASVPNSKELTFVVQAKAGFSRRLYNRAISSLPTTSEPSKGKSYVVLVDGPYGRPPNFLQYDTLVLIAGSTGATFTVPILLQAVQTSAKCVRRIEFLWIVKAGAHFEWFAREIEDAMEAAVERGIELEITCCVTCDPLYATNHPGGQSFSRRSKVCSCACSTEMSSSGMELGDRLSTISNSNEEKGDRNSIASGGDFSALARKSCCCVDCGCSAVGSQAPSVSLLSGRPDLRGIMERSLRLARGETGVAVCGPVGLMSRTRTVVAELSDERGAEKGTGAYGVCLFGEGFGW